MQNVSDAFRAELNNDNRRYLKYCNMTLSDGTVLEIDNTSFWEGGLRIEDATSSNTAFDIGSAIVGKCTLTLNNIYDDFSGYDFSEAEAIVYVGLKLSDGSIERIRKGTFAVDDPIHNGSIITLSCLDNMRKFDRPYSESTLTYPATLFQIVWDACSVCGVSLLSGTFPNASYTVNQRPNSEAITFREIIAWVAQIACCWAKCDAYGRLYFGWYDTTDIVAPYLLSTTDAEAVATTDNELLELLTDAVDPDFLDDRIYTPMHRIVSLSSQSVALNDVRITGIKVTEDFAETEDLTIQSALFGESGYVLSITGNKLIQAGEAATVAEMIGIRSVGMKFRPMEITCLSDPSIEAGDRAYVIDRKKNIYTTYITSTTFQPGSYQEVLCSAETPARNNEKRYDLFTKLLADAKKNIKKQIGTYDLAVQQLTSLITQSFGVYKSEEVLEDGSTIYYMHNKPTLEESQTIWKMTADAFAVSTDGGKTWNAGIDSAGNAVVNVLSAIGVKADWIEADNLNTISANIGGWKIGTQSIYKDIVDPLNYDVVYRVYFQPPLTSSPDKTWILSCQKSTDGGKIFYGNFILYSDGSASFGNGKIKLNADGSASFGSTTISAEGQIKAGNAIINADGSAQFGTTQIQSDGTLNYVKIGKTNNGYTPYTGNFIVALSDGSVKALSFDNGILRSASS